MENPTFKMEGVIKSKDDMEDFEGPLTLLLHLLSKNKVEIQDIRISDILEQYLRYLEDMKGMDLEIASEFVQMASNLVYIKTRTLLSGQEEIPELEMLKMSMEELQNKDIYKQIREISLILFDMSSIGAGYIEKPPEHIKASRKYKYTHDVLDLTNALSGIFELGQAITPEEGRAFVMPTPIVYSVSAKADELMESLKTSGDVRVSSLFEHSGSRSEIVATLIAILELCKMGNIVFSPSDTEDYTVRFVKSQKTSITAV